MVDIYKEGIQWFQNSQPKDPIMIEGASVEGYSNIHESRGEMYDNAEESES